MTTLHLISNHLTSEELQANLRRYSNDGDSLLFVGAAVSSLINQTVFEILNLSDLALFALEADIQCRGIHHLVTANVSLISDTQMVELTVQANQVISW